MKATEQYTFVQDCLLRFTRWFYFSQYLINETRSFVELCFGGKEWNLKTEFVWLEEYHGKNLNGSYVQLIEFLLFTGG